LIDLSLTKYSQKAKAPLSVVADKHLLAQLQAMHGSLAAEDFRPGQVLAALHPLIERGALIDAACVKAAVQTMWNIGIRGSSYISLGPDRWLPTSTVNPWPTVSDPKPKTEGSHVPRDLGELCAASRAQWRPSVTLATCCGCRR
jgi:roadblock/LC7 domain-containing protein